MALFFSLWLTTFHLLEPQFLGSQLPGFQHLSSYPLFLSLGIPELSIIVLLVLILFGPGKLPSVMKTLGDGVKQFKDSANGSLSSSNENEKKPEK
ncbi:MAG: twin-arginine translocase TatA/TatE family subunit [Cyanobacteria bacterium P01_H01_bin.74]